MLIALVGLAAGCSCQEPAQVGPPPVQEPDTSEPVDSARVDTAPPPPCEVPEQEPNDASASATSLPMEAIGCGTWSQPLDLDTFAFDLEEEGWVSVRVWAKPLGSSANAHLTVQAADGSLASHTDDEGTTDASVVFPGKPQRYTVILAEQNFNGGERYIYEVAASVTKPPVAWTRQEVEPNDDVGSAERVGDGDVVYGDMGASAEGDWYRIDVPPGKHTLIVDIEAYAHGSTGDFSMVLYDAAVQPLPLGCKQCVIEGPPDHYARDPLLDWESPGNEVLYLRVYEDEGKSGDAVWYAMSVTLEGP